MMDNEPGGLKVLYDMLVKAAEYPGESSHSMRNLELWENRLRTLHHVMVQFYSDTQTTRYNQISESMRKLAESANAEEYLAKGYHLMFEFLGEIAIAFKSEKLLLESPYGLRTIYDLFVQAMDYPHHNVMNPANVVSWQDRLEAMHFVMKGYHTDAYKHDHQIVKSQLHEAIRHYPSDQYVSATAEALFGWIGAIARLFQEMNILIPYNLFTSEHVRRKNEKAVSR